jgi:hypothetical protein
MKEDEKNDDKEENKKEEEEITRPWRSMKQKHQELEAYHQALLAKDVVSEAAGETERKVLEKKSVEGNEERKDEKGEEPNEKGEEAKEKGKDPKEKGDEQQQVEAEQAKEVGKDEQKEVDKDKKDDNYFDLSQFHTAAQVKVDLLVSQLMCWTTRSMSQLVLEAMGVAPKYNFGSVVNSS